jgi:plastocyanin
MKNKLVGTLCLGGLSMMGLLLWEPPVRAADQAVKITSSMTFDPTDVPQLSVKDKITWTGAAGPPHHLYYGPVGDDTKELTPRFNNGKATSLPFTDPYTGPYHCSIHSTMLGKLTVTAK